VRRPAVGILSHVRAVDAEHTKHKQCRAECATGPVSIDRYDGLVMKKE
jgi:hypothetical protein